MDTEILEEVGLSRREAKLYLALVDLGRSSVGPLVERTDIPSSKIYEVLGRLEEKGFVNHIFTKKRKEFKPSDPEIILDKLDRRKKKFEKYLSELKERQRAARETQFAEFYEGKEAIFSLIRGLVKKADKGTLYRSFAFDYEIEQEDFAAFLSGLALLRKEKGLKSKTLFRRDLKKIVNREFPQSAIKAMNIRYTDETFPEGVFIIGNNLLLIEWEDEPTAVRIYNDFFAKNFSDVFDEMYNDASSK